MKKSKTQIIRFFIQLSFLVFLIVAGFVHQIKGGGPTGSASVDALCPFGGVETLYKFITTGQFVDRIQASSLILLGAVILLVLLTSRAFCGWICPFGTVQEWFGWLGRKLMGKNLTVPQKLDKPLRMLKYLVLALIVLLTWTTATLVFRPYDPWVAFMHLGSGAELLKDFPYALGILAVVLILSFLVDRFWCKYLCPLGAFMNIFNRFSLFKVSRAESTCIGCGKCNKECQMNVNVKAAEVVKSLECINCLKCVSACPVDNTVKTKALWTKSQKYVSSTAFIIVTLAVFFGVYFTSQLTGTWEAKGQLPVSTTIESIDVDSIKGYMTLNETASYTHMEIKELYKVLGIPENVPSDTKLKDVSGYVEGFTPDAAKEKLKEQK